MTAADAWRGRLPVRLHLRPRPAPPLPPAAQGFYSGPVATLQWRNHDWIDVISIERANEYPTKGEA